MKVNPFFIAIIIGLLLFGVACSKEEIKETKEIQSSLPKYTFEEGVFPPSPSGFVKIDETRYEMAKGGFRWEMGNMTTETDVAGPTQIAENYDAIEAEPSGETSIEIEQSPKLRLFLWEAENQTTPIQLNATEMVLPEEEGRYIYEVRAAWENGQVSYTFVVEVKTPIK